MNREELTNYVFKFWQDWGAFNWDERTDEELKNEIYNHLGHSLGIDRELDYVRFEFEAGWDENSLEYERLTDLWNNLNYYKTNFKGDEIK